MSIWQNVNGTWRKGTLWQNVAGTWRKVTVCANVNGMWKKDTSSGGGGGGGSSLALTANPQYVFGSVNRISSGRVYTSYTTASASGGTAPYVYAWGAQPDWQIDFPTSANTRFSSVIAPGDDKVTTFTCTVTDAKGSTATFNVTAEVANFYSGGKANNA